MASVTTGKMFVLKSKKVEKESVYFIEKANSFPYASSVITLKSNCWDLAKGPTAVWRD